MEYEQQEASNLQVENMDIQNGVRWVDFFLYFLLLEMSDSIDVIINLSIHSVSYFIYEMLFAMQFWIAWRKRFVDPE